ncbi:MAG: Gfo/Idh/MocA family oxidoreductase [Candidatus Latescibacteria bacterium]|nr:Gfo/Idh/MocA family oxidoreductase [Candidatus Latescibacterota bacterium]
MNQEVNNNIEQDLPQTGNGKFFNRRDVLMGLATLPVLGIFFQKLYKKWHLVEMEKAKSEQLLADLGLSGEAPSILPSKSLKTSGETLRLGFVGYGSRGEYLMRAAGFAHPSWIENMKQAKLDNKNDPRLDDFYAQDDLNVVFNGVCDAFSIRAEEALVAVQKGNNKGKENNGAKIYRSYKDMLESDDIDAILVATPEHWHAQMAIDAARAGKHIYLEKPLCLTIPEIYEVVDEVKKSGIKFQLGHQSRQTDAYMMAREVVKQNVLGKISLVSLTTNRNDPNGAWIYPIHPEATPMNIDWRQFYGKTKRRPPNMERFFRWRLWYDYGSGLSGDLLTHEFDAVNMILELGIPNSAVATGGVYYYKDGREVPDVYNATYEFTDRDLTLLYSATLASNATRGKLFMGSDATMSFGQLHASALSVSADKDSLRFKDKIEKGIIDPEYPMFSYSPGSKGFDAVTTATEKYFAGRGLLYTYRDGKRVDTTHLHVKEWLDAIRTGGDTSCNIDRGFEEAVTAHMGTLSYKIGRKVEWDHENKVIKNIVPPTNWTDEEVQKSIEETKLAFRNS